MPLQERAVYLAYQTDCLPCALREQCLAPGAKGNRARRVSAVRRLLPPPSSVERKPVVLGPMRWVDVSGRALRRTWTAHWRRQYVEILPLTDMPQSVSPPSRPPRAVRSHHRWSWQDRLARNAWSGPPQLRVTVAGVPAFLAMNERRRNWPPKRLFQCSAILPLSGSAGRGSSVYLPQPASLPQRLSDDAGEVPLRAEAIDATKNDLEPLRLKVHLVAHPVGSSILSDFECSPVLCVMKAGCTASSSLREGFHRTCGRAVFGKISMSEREIRRQPEVIVTMLAELATSMS